MRRASRAEAAGSRVTPADVVCFNSATRAETSTGSCEPVIGNSFHVASSPCHSVLSHDTITDSCQENFASERSMRNERERNEVYASCTAPPACPQRLFATLRCQLRQRNEKWAAGATRDSNGRPFCAVSHEVQVCSRNGQEMGGECTHLPSQPLPSVHRCMGEIPKPCTQGRGAFCRFVNNPQVHILRECHEYDVRGIGAVGCTHHLPQPLLLVNRCRNASAALWLGGREADKLWQVRWLP